LLTPSAVRRTSKDERGYMRAALEYAYKLRFLCHNSLDKPLVRDVCQALRHDFGVAAYLDESQLIGGDDWHRAIHQALTTSNVCVIFVGANGRESISSQVKRGQH
jgi:hypothetical protein